MSVRHPAAVFECDNSHCDAISVTDASPYQLLPLPDGWWSLDDSDPATQRLTFCSDACLRHRVIEIHEEGRWS